MDRRGGRGVGRTPRLAMAVVMPALGMGLLVLGACGGGDGASQVTLGRGASTVAGDVPAVATLSQPSTPGVAGDPSAAAVAPGGAPAAEPSSSVVAAGDRVPASAPAPSAGPSTAATAARELGVVHGIVTRSGQPVVGASVTLSSPDGTERITTTDATGAYRFAAVAPGSYELVAYAESGATCDANGCISASWAEKAEVRLEAGETRRVDISA